MSEQLNAMKMHNCLKITNRRVRKILHNCNNSEYEFRHHVVKLTKNHKEVRLKLAHKYMLWDY